ncbi:MAG: hypothetical protein D6814_01950, partial [Calditrichaeota bacterium]
MPLLSSRTPIRKTAFTAHPLKLLWMRWVSLSLALWLLNPAANFADGNCNKTSVGKTPLIDMGSNAYKGFEGGLYPGGTNTPPAG